MAHTAFDVDDDGHCDGMSFERLREIWLKPGADPEGDELRARDLATVADATDALTQLDGALAMRSAHNDDLTTRCMRAAADRLRAIRQRHGENT